MAKFRDEVFIRNTLPELLGILESTVIIALSGRRKAGKTKSAEIICAFDPSFQKMSFADTLKNEYASEVGCLRADLDNTIYKEEHRIALQQFSESYLAADPYYFVRKLFLDVIPGSKVVIDDNRYLAELRTVWSAGGACYKVDTDIDVKRLTRGWQKNKEADAHISETELGDLCAHTMYCLGGGIIFNNGSLLKLEERLFEIVKKTLYAGVC
jgi:phosphomevalonate kinase